MNANLCPITLSVRENWLLTGVAFLSDSPADLPQDDGLELMSEEQSLYLSTPFLCTACGEEDCDGDCAAAYLLTVRGRVEADGPSDEMCPEFAHCYRESEDRR